MRKRISMDNWKRKLAYDTFSNYTDPYTGIVTKVNITNLVDYCKVNNVSFYACMTYFVMSSLSSIEAFSYGYGKESNEQYVFKYDNLAVTATTINSNGNLNFTRYVEYTDDIEKFIRNFQYAIKDASFGVKYYKIPNLENMNKINVTCIPWISFSNFKDAINTTEKNSKPKVCWDKYYEEHGNYVLDVSLLVNHAFQDGLHIGLFFNNLEQLINNINIEKENDMEVQNYVKKI